MLTCHLLLCRQVTAGDTFNDIPRVDVHAHCGKPERMAERYHRCFQLLETDEMVQGSFFDDQKERRGLALPRDVLEKIYYRNALRIYPRLKEVDVLTGQRDNR